ncbi:MAG: DUF3488 domain-containing protein [Proteobacteria bacterium]|nr:MAG: DUF3488 domain-containing protein [Pseudomonadota bacterium]
MDGTLVKLPFGLPRPPRAPERVPSRAALCVLFATTALAMSPHLLRQPAWLGAATVAIVLWRLYNLLRDAPPPRAVIRIALSVALVGLILAQYQTIFGRTAGSALLVGFTGLKVLETSAIRDAMFCNILVGVVVLAVFLFDQSPGTAAFGLACLVLIIVNFNLLASPARIDAARALRLTTRIVLHGIPLAIAAYLLFPRIEGSLWGVAEQPPTATTGLTDTVAPGTITRLTLNDDVAFRVEFDGEAPERASLYWRALVLEDFDGRSWTRVRKRRESSTPRIHGAADRIGYRIVLEASGNRYLPALELPVSISGGRTIGEEAVALSKKPIRERIRYRVESVNATYLQTREPAEPARIAKTGDAVRALAAELAAPGGGAEAIAMRALSMFREQPFHYTLSPPPLGPDPVQDFLLETRRGYCEHYASAFTVLMRAAGVPARVVLGYQGGENNPSGDYWIVRQSDAHAWSEIWVDGSGWRRVDPTAAVAPERVELGVDALRRIESAGGLESGFSAERMRQILRLDWLSARIKQIELFADAFTHQWNTWVLAYGPDQQRQLLLRLGFAAPDWTWMVLALAASVAAFMLATYIVLSRTGREPDSPLKHFRRFKRKLERAGMPTLPGEGPRDLCRRAALAFPGNASQIDTIGDRYLALRYGPAGRARLTELRRLVRELRIDER